MLPLEELANIDEGSVRDAAITAITAVVAELDDARVQKHVLPLFTRLSSGFVRISASYDWYSSKLASCSLLPALLPRLEDRAAAQAFSGAVANAPAMDLRARLLRVVEQFA